MLREYQVGGTVLPLGGGWGWGVWGVGWAQGGNTGVRAADWLARYPAPPRPSPPSWPHLTAPALSSPCPAPPSPHPCATPLQEGILERFLKSDDPPADNSGPVKVCACHCWGLGGGRLHRAAAVRASCSPAFRPAQRRRTFPAVHTPFLQVIVGKTFEREVLKSGKDCFLELYAPWW